MVLACLKCSIKTPPMTLANIPLSCFYILLFIYKLNLTKTLKICYKNIVKHSYIIYIQNNYYGKLIKVKCSLQQQQIIEEQCSKNKINR